MGSDGLGGCYGTEEKYHSGQVDMDYRNKLDKEEIESLQKELETTKKLFEEAIEVIENLLYQHVGYNKDGNWNFTAISANDDAEEFLAKLSKEGEI